MDNPLPEGLCRDFDKFFESESTRKPGQDIYPDIFETGLLFPLQRQRELIEMIQVARTKNPKVIFEIGTDKGGGLYHWCKCFPEVEKVIACEVRGTPFSKLFEKAFPHIDFLWLPVSSYDPEVVLKVEDWLAGDRIDILFIDGDKAQFLLDFICYREYVSLDGVVFMHDVQDSSPKYAFEQVQKRGYKTRTIINKQDAHESLEREELEIEATCAHENWLRHWKGTSCGVGVIEMGASE